MWVRVPPSGYQKKGVLNIFTCDICGASFDSPLKLGGHKSGHARSGKTYKKGENYSFNCLYCEKPVETYIKPSYLDKERPKYCSLRCKQDWYAKNVYFSHETSFAKIKGDTLDITNAELKAYREQHQVCEICGKEEKVSTRKDGERNNLAVDHNHTTGHFRGLLCYSCNIKIGWIEANWDKAKSYLERDGFKT